MARTTRTAELTSPEARHAFAGTCRAWGAWGDVRRPPMSVALMGAFPPARLLPRRVVEVHDDLPDLLLGEAIFPGRHHGVPRRRFLGQARSALGDAPEQ